MGAGRQQVLRVLKGTHTHTCGSHAACSEEQAARVFHPSPRSPTLGCAVTCHSSASTMALLRSPHVHCWGFPSCTPGRDTGFLAPPAQHRGP